MQTFLAAETDATCRRNAFVTLINIAPSRAIEYFLQVYDGIANLDELMQLSVIELVRKDIKDSKGETAQKPRYIRAIFELLNATSHSVKYEAASMLTTLTQNPAAVKGEADRGRLADLAKQCSNDVFLAAASCFIDLIVKESDNNVKLIVLDRVETLRAKHDHVLDGLVMEILRVLSSPDMEVRRMALSIALDMVSSRNVEEVVLFLKKELLKTLDGQYDKVTSPCLSFSFRNILNSW